MQFSIKHLLIVQAIVAVILFLSRFWFVLAIVGMLYVPMWFFMAVWGTIRIAGRKGSDNLFFYPAIRPESEKQSQAIPNEIAKFLEHLKASGLLTDDQVDDFPNYFSQEEWEDVSKEPGQVAAQMVEQGLLTRWQADLLLAGRYDGFFIKRYELLDVLEKGQISTVYLAADHARQKQVAIKVLDKTAGNEVEQEEHFRRVARLPPMLNHARFVQSQDFMRDHQIYFVVQEYEPGVKLPQYVSAEGPIAALTAIEYLTQVAEGLERIHHFDLVHRDLRPEHLLLTEEHGIKILGLSSMVSIKRARQEKVDAQSQYFGSPDYLAPELVFDPAAVGPAADIYSLGCLFHYLLTGRPPYAADSFEAMMQQHQTAPIPSLQAELGDLPNSQRVLAIYERMMAKNPADRYSDGGALFEDLYEYLQGVN